MVVGERHPGDIGHAVGDGDLPQAVGGDEVPLPVHGGADAALERERADLPQGRGQGDAPEVIRPAQEAVAHARDALGEFGAGDLPTGVRPRLRGPCFPLSFVVVIVRRARALDDEGQARFKMRAFGAVFSLVLYGRVVIVVIRPVAVLVFDQPPRRVLAADAGCRLLVPGADGNRDRRNQKENT